MKYPNTQNPSPVAEGRGKDGSPGGWLTLSAFLISLPKSGPGVPVLDCASEIRNKAWASSRGITMLFLVFIEMKNWRVRP
jgi:hypothetical protein